MQSVRIWPTRREAIFTSTPRRSIDYLCIRIVVGALAVVHVNVTLAFLYRLTCAASCMVHNCHTYRKSSSCLMVLNWRWRFAHTTSSSCQRYSSFTHEASLTLTITLTLTLTLTLNAIPRLSTRPPNTYFSTPGFSFEKHCHPEPLVTTGPPCVSNVCIPRAPSQGLCGGLGRGLGLGLRLGLGNVQGLPGAQPE